MKDILRAELWGDSIGRGVIYDEQRRRYAVDGRAMPISCGKTIWWISRTTHVSALRLWRAWPILCRRAT